MNKITLEITADKLNALLFALSELPELNSIEKSQKAVYSIFDEVYTKLLKKQVDKRNEEANKAFKMKLKYYEAFALCETVGTAYNLLSSGLVYEQNACRMVYNQLDRQL